MEPLGKKTTYDNAGMLANVPSPNVDRSPIQMRFDQLSEAVSELDMRVSALVQRLAVITEQEQQTEEKPHGEPTNPSMCEFEAALLRSINQLHTSNAQLSSILSRLRL